MPPYAFGGEPNFDFTMFPLPLSDKSPSLDYTRDGLFELAADPCIGFNRLLLPSSFKLSMVSFSFKL